MKIFLSWSGEVSYKIAAIFAEWLPSVLQAVTPYFSPATDKGVRWGTVVSKELDDCQVGILFMTESNLAAEWVLFEAGALSKSVAESRVIPFLINITPADLPESLAQFQAVSFEREDILGLVQTLNGILGERALSEAKLLRTFEKWWSELEEKVNAVLRAHPAVSPGVPDHSITDAAETVAKGDEYPGAIIVRAWFDTVINPMLDTLTSEQDYLAARRWTWRVHGGGLSELHDLNFKSSSDYAHNREQFFDFYSSIREAVEAHDVAASEVRALVENLFDRIRRSPEFRDIYRGVTTPAALGSLQAAHPDKIGRYDATADGVLRDLFSTSPSDDDRLAFLAQYVVNGTGELADNYTPAPLWNTHRAEFLGILTHPPMRRQVEELEAARDKLSRSVESLVELLKECRRQLSQQFRVPFASSNLVVEGW